jgi:hypothetical protein
MLFSEGEFALRWRLLPRGNLMAFRATPVLRTLATVAAAITLMAMSQASPGVAITTGGEGVAADQQGNIYSAEVGEKDVKKFVNRQ